MKLHVRIISMLFVLLMLFSLASCVGEYQNATSAGNHNTDTDDEIEDGGDEGFVPPEMNDDPTDDFTVTILADGAPYTPRSEMFVTWTDGFSMYKAKVDEYGTAKIDGLDGDYRVTLSGVTNEYAYDPNAYIATNDNKNIILNLYTLNHLSGSSTGLYDCYSFKKTGVYTAVIYEPSDAIYFQYAPETMGTYSIESWIDTTADTVNPYIEIYGGHSEYKFFIETRDDGGPVGSYTINFVHEVQIAKENISAGGQATYTFAIKAESKNNIYPVTITFAVKRNGDFELNYTSSITPGSGMVAPTYDYSSFNKEDHEYDKSQYTIADPEYQLSAGSNIYVFDDSRYKLWEKKDGGDDFYHLYDKEKYPETNGYGPILYAYITEKPRSFIDRAFTRLEYKNASAPANGGNDETTNAALSYNGKNYKHLIEGYTKLSTYGAINGASYYCSNECTCHDVNESKVGWACTSECTNCTSGCRRIPAELIGFEGYQSMANSDGLVPVTQDIVNFLKDYTKKVDFFRDGLGSMENKTVNGRVYQSVGSSGWLFACAYYEQK